jgi:hypothetical protein
VDNYFRLINDLVLTCVNAHAMITAKQKNKNDTKNEKQKNETTGTTTSINSRPQKNSFWTVWRYSSAHGLDHTGRSTKPSLCRTNYCT